MKVIELREDALRLVIVKCSLHTKSIGFKDAFFRHNNWPYLIVQKMQHLIYLIKAHTPLALLQLSNKT